MKVAKDLEVKEIREGIEMQNEEEETEIDHKNPMHIEDAVMEENKTKVEKLKARQTRAKRGIPNNTESIQCAECQAVFTKRCDLLRHYRSTHEGV